MSRGQSVHTCECVWCGYVCVCICLYVCLCTCVCLSVCLSLCLSVCGVFSPTIISAFNAFCVCCLGCMEVKVHVPVLQQSRSPNMLLTLALSLSESFYTGSCATQNISNCITQNTWVTASHRTLVTAPHRTPVTAITQTTRVTASHRTLVTAPHRMLVATPHRTLVTSPHKNGGNCNHTDYRYPGDCTTQNASNCTVHAKHWR